jgi:hypothetical protein
MELVELQRLLQDPEADHITEAGRLVILVRDVSKVLVDLAMPPSRGSPPNPCMAYAYTSGHGP